MGRGSSGQQELLASWTVGVKGMSLHTWGEEGQIWCRGGEGWQGEGGELGASRWQLGLPSLPWGAGWGGEQACGEMLVHWGSAGGQVPGQHQSLCPLTSASFPSQAAAKCVLFL